MITMLIRAEIVINYNTTVVMIVVIVMIIILIRATIVMNYNTSTDCGDSNDNNVDNGNNSNTNYIICNSNTNYIICIPCSWRLCRKVGNIVLSRTWKSPFLESSFTTDQHAEVGFLPRAARSWAGWASQASKWAMGQNPILKSSNYNSNPIYIYINPYIHGYIVPQTMVLIHPNSG